MSEDKIKRRRFLADILFAGGAISLAALLAQATRSSSSPAPVTSPSAQTTPEPMVQGEMVLPQAPPTPPMVNPYEPQVKGKVSMPQSRPKNGP